MKKLFYSALVLLALVACKKDKANGPGSGSIMLAHGYSEPRISNNFVGSDTSVVAVLMTMNNLSANGLDFYAYSQYYALDQNSQTALFQTVMAIQVRNGLPVFSSDLDFGFENGKPLGGPPAQQYIIGDIALDNKPTQSLQTLRDKFITIDHAQEAHDISIQDSVLVAQLGYYNINAASSNSTPDYIKMWYVHPSHVSWPMGYFRDDDGSLISFDPLTHSGPVNP